MSSKRIEDLRGDVADNCRVWLALCEAEGLDVAISNTRRDNEYQAQLYAQGRTAPGNIVTNSKTTTFHGQGLAIDFYSRSTGWGDHGFFERCGAIAKRVGFSWAGDWTRFVEYCHIQWDKHGAAGHLNAPAMPKYEEEIEVTKEEMRAMVEPLVAEAVTRELAERDMALARVAQKVSPWAAEAWERATEKGIFDGTRPGAALTREMAAVVMERVGLGE